MTKLLILFLIFGFCILGIAGPYSLKSYGVETTNWAKSKYQLCTSYDKEEDPFVKGKTMTCGFIPRVKIADKCADSNTLLEYMIRKQSIVYYNMYRYFKCPAGCVDGACIKPCTNGASNPPQCTNCPSGQIIQAGKCVAMCSTGACVDLSKIPNTTNEKNLLKYPSKVVFLTGDTRVNGSLAWTDTLLSLPAAIWTKNDNSVEINPILIYHREGNSFDGDAIIDFLNAYQATDLVTTGNMPNNLRNLIISKTNIALEKITTKSHQDLWSYWKAFDTVVYVRANYEYAMQASVYASLLNAPLVIQGVNDGVNLEGRRVICTPSKFSSICTEGININQLQARYKTLTNTNKIILTNASLRNFSITEKKNALPIGNSFQSLYANSSLAAPILASAKHEIIFNVFTTDSLAVNTSLKNYIARLKIQPEYLTIVASPKEIQQIQKTEYEFGTAFRSIDSARYGNLDDDPYGFAEMKVGRIYGFSVSDISSYIMRVLFYNKLEQSDDILITKQAFQGHGYRAEIYKALLTDKGHPVTVRTENNRVTPTDFMHKKFIFHNEHGSPYSSGLITEDIPALQNPVIFANSCLTCAFDKLDIGNYGRLFCLQLLRKGATGVVAAVDSAGFVWEPSIIERVMSDDLGTIFKDYRNTVDAYKQWYINFWNQASSYVFGDIEFLLGDPTHKISFKYPNVLPPSSVKITENNSEKAVEATWPSISINYGSYNFVYWTNGMETEVDWATRAFTKIGPFQDMPESPTLKANLNTTKNEKLQLMAVHKDVDGYYLYIYANLYLANNPLDTIVNNYFTFTVK